MRSEEPAAGAGRLRYRKAEARDSRAIHALIYRVGINPMGLDWRRFLIAVDEQDRLVGCGQVKPHGDGTRELSSIAVQPAWRGQGVASEIIRKLLAENDPPLYITCSANLGPFYEKFGFQIVEPPELPTYFRRIQRAADLISQIFPRAGRLLVMLKTGL